MTTLENQSQIHPLLGNILPTATNVTIFESKLNLKDLPYIKDHVVGTNVIFPAVGYLEMSLAAGLATIEGSEALKNLNSFSRKCFKIENFKILSPLRLLESKSCHMQTVVNSNPAGSLEVKTFITGDNLKWHLKTEATFDVMDSTSVEDIREGFTDDKFRTILNTAGNKDICTDIYKLFDSAGLHLGPLFRTCDLSWRDEDSFLIKLKKPSDSSKYIFHPTILDGMLQAYWYHLFSNHFTGKLFMPVQIGSFVVVQTPDDNDELYLYVYSSKKDKSTSALIISDRGKVFAKVTKVELFHTTVKVLESILDQQDTPLPQMWEESWVTQNVDASNWQLPTTDEQGTWVVFASQLPFLESLMEKVEAAGRNVVRVYPSSEFRKEGNDCCFIDVNSKDDIKALITSVGAEHVEGVLYGWPLDKGRQKQEEIVQPYLYLAQIISDWKSPPKLITLTCGAAPTGESDCTNFHSGTIWGLAKSFKNEHFDIKTKCVDISAELIQQEETVEAVFSEMWRDDSETQVAYNAGLRSVPRLNSYKPKGNELTLPPGTDRFQLELPETKSIEDLCFIPRPAQTLGKLEVEIQVKAYGLNFKDILNVIKPSDGFTDTIGVDFAGVVSRIGSGVSRWSVGDPVVGGNVVGECFASHKVIQENCLMRISHNLTFAEAATLPTVFATAYYCLVNLANLSRGEIVLIHTASGGVGLAAIQIAKYLGANIIATAGSPKKQSYLKSIGIEHVFNSRNTDYEKEILEVTGGRGVDVVLNSLTSEEFKEATVRACAPGTRFIEMSILNVFLPSEMKTLRADIYYEVFDMEETSAWKLLLHILSDFLENKVIRPLPYHRYDGVNIRQAMGFLQTTKHIGKVVCIMPEKKKTPQNELKTTTPMFNDRSSYLITGGLGGIGWEVAKWMLENGAKHLILAGRSKPSDDLKTKISQLNLQLAGGNVHTVCLDVANFEQVKLLLEDVSDPKKMNMPQLRGIMHAAGTLADGMIANQTWEKFSSTFPAKIDGTLNLHNLTRDYSLEHFVVFSSVVALFGTPGQANHAAGNNFQDCFVHYRHSLGLAATSVNWGPWGEVGVAKQMDIAGLRPLTTSQGLAVLDHVMRNQRLQTCVVTIDSFVLFGKRHPQLEFYLDKRIQKSTNSRDQPSSSSVTLESDEFWHQYMSSSTPKSKGET